MQSRNHWVITIKNHNVTFKTRVLLFDARFLMLGSCRKLKASYYEIQLLCPSPGGIRWWCCLTSVAYIQSVGGVCCQPAGWRILDDTCPARPAWLKAAAARFHCRPRLGHILMVFRLHYSLFIIGLVCPLYALLMITTILQLWGKICSALVVGCTSELFVLSSWPFGSYCKPVLSAI